MTILITGGAGFIGSNYVFHKRLNAPDTIILNFDKLTYAGNLASLGSLEPDPKHIFVQGDIGNRQLVKELLDLYQPQAILNFAAETHVDRSIDGPGAFIHTNIVGTFNLLETTRHYWQRLSPIEQEQFRFLHVSTDEVFGTLELDDPPFAETTAYAPNSPYSASKASSDHLVRSYFHTYNLPTLITNCSNNYGPYQFPEKLIPLMILNAIEGKPLPVYGDGQNIRDWLFVEDHCRAIDLVLMQGQSGETYNIGGGEEKTNIGLVQQICSILDELLPHSEFVPHAQLITFVQDRPGHDRRYAINFTKIKRQLGWAPSMSIESGLKETVQWYLDNRAWCEAVTASQYQRQRLGLVKANT